MKPKEVEDGLTNLARYLYMHYNNTKLFLLIDEYDAVITDTVKVSEKHLRRIIKLFMG